MSKQRIVITDAHEPTGSALVESLKGRGYHVTALTDEIANLEADRIICKWTWSDDALHVIQNAEVVIWLGRTYFVHRASFERDQRRVAESVIRGLERGRNQRLIVLSHLLTKAARFERESSWGKARKKVRSNKL